MDTRRIALVTGAGRGIGAAIARELARAGVGVVVAARTLEECERLAAELRQGGAAAWAVELDVGEPQSIAAAVARARELAGEVDWLVNNAGIAVSAPLAPKDGSGDELYERHLRINFHGARRMAEALLPSMRARKYGRIVNVASSAGLRGYRYVAAYCASKHALVGWARAAALELEGTGVQVASVCPHYVDSPMTDASVKTIVAKTGRSENEARALLAAENPAGKLVRPEQIAQVVRSLAEGGTNGALVELDGGMPRYHPAPR
ncbi:MAG: SDR family NAD(P)-dependent oxidoreductase [Planctomycetota bacterium]|nr:SDR family NAD(P)-dependent oxidoreductase [Planctomycetota bacterium]